MPEPEKLVTETNPSERNKEYNPDQTMDEKTILSIKKDKIMADERFTRLSDERKKEVLGNLFDDHGMNILKKQGISDPEKTKALKDKWVERVFNGTEPTTSKKKDSTEAPSDFSGDGQAISSEAGKGKTGKFFVDLFSRDSNNNTTVDQSIPQTENAPVGETITPQPEDNKAIPDFREGLIPEQSASQSSTMVDTTKNPEIEKDIVKEGSEKSINELQVDLQNVNTKIQEFTNEKTQQYKSPFLSTKEAALDFQYKQAIESGMPEQDAKMNRDIELSKIYAENPEDYADMLLKTDRANPALKPAMDLANKANDLNKIYNDIKSNNGWENLGEGVKEGIKSYAKDYVEFLGGFSTNKAITALSDKIQKINDGENLKFNEDEKLLLQTLVTTSELTNKINKELPTGYNIGQGIGGSLGFMAEFGLTYGLGSGIKAVKMSANVAATLATSGVQTAAMPTLYKEIAKNSSQGQDFGNSLFNAYYDTYTEVLSERLFTGTIGGSSNGFQKFINRTGIRTAGKPLNVLKASGEEYLEDKFAEAMKGAKDAKRFEQFASDFFDAKQNLTTLATTALMTGTMSLHQMGGLAMDKYSELKFNNKFKAVSTALPNEVKTGIDEILSNQDLTVEDANKLLKDLITANVMSGNIKEEQGKEVVVNAQQYFLLSLQKQAQEGKLVDKEAPPIYTIGDKVVETKEELLSEVEKLKGQENTPEIQVENDEETAKKVNEILEVEPVAKGDKNTPTMDELANIQDKVMGGEELTKEEQKIWDNEQLAPKGFKYDNNGNLVPKKKSTKEEINPADQFPDAGKMIEEPKTDTPQEINQDINNEPLKEEIKPTDEAVVVKTENAVQEKLNSQKEAKSNAVFKEQKTQLLDDLKAAEDILLGVNKESAKADEENMVKSGVKKDQIDSLITNNYEHDLNKLPKEVESELNKRGIKVKDGKLVIDVYKDGTVQVGDIRTAMGLIEKGFPQRVPESNKLKNTSLPGQKEKDIISKAESYGSLEESNRRLKIEEDNLAEAKKSGNKGLEKVMQEQFDYEKKVNDAAKTMDYEAVKKRKAIESDTQLQELYKQDKNKATFDIVPKDELFDILEKQGRPKEITRETVMPLIIKDKLDKEGKTWAQKEKELIAEIFKLDLELKDKYGRKDGNGLRQPKNNNEAWEIKRMQSKLENIKKELSDLKQYEKQIKESSKKEQPKREEKPKESKEPESTVLGSKKGGKKYETEPSPLSQTEFQEVPKLREILTRLSTGLGKNIKYSIIKKYAGFYNPTNALIAIKKANDIETVTHEVGHFFDDKYKVLEEVSPSLEKELSKYWGGGSKPHKGMSEEEKQVYKQQEGFAEWLRVFVLNPDEAMKSEEIYDLYVSKVSKEDRDVIRNFSNEIRTLLGQNKLMGISSIIHTDNPEKSTLAKRIFPSFLYEPLKDKASFTTHFLNQFFNSEEGFRKAMKIKGIEKILPTKDFRMLSRLTLGHDDVFFNVMEKGMIDKNYKILIDKETNEPKTLKWLFNPANGKDFGRDIEINRNRMVAERTIEFIDNIIKEKIVEDLNRDLLPSDAILEQYPELNEVELKPTIDTETGEPIEMTVAEKVEQLKEAKTKPQDDKRYNVYKNKDVSGISLGVKNKNRNDYTVAKESLKSYEEHIKAYPEKKKVYDELKRRYQELANDNLLYALEKGRISQETYDRIKSKNQQYIALSRIKQTEIGGDIFEDAFFKNKSGKAIGDVQEVLKGFKGSTKDILNPYVALINSSYSIIKEANRNEAIRSFTELLKGNRGMRQGDLMELAEIGFQTSSPHDPYTITVYNNGEKEYWRFDPAVYESLKGMDDVTHALPLVLTAYAKVLRPAVTTFPVFQLKNRIRDLQNRLIISEYWPSFSDYRNKKKGKVEYETTGGGQFGYHLKNKGSYFDMIKKTMKDVESNKNTLFVNPKNIGEVYNRLLGNSETKTRVEEYYHVYDNYKKQGYSDLDARIAATFAARDLLDFKVMGKSIRAINQVIPFTNAKIQGFRRLSKSIDRNPAKTMAKFMIYALIPQIANTLLIKDQDDDVIQEYKDLSMFRKTLFYNIPIHKLGLPNVKWLTIPKPFEIGVIASAIGIPIDDAILGDKMGDQLNSDYVKFLLSAASPVDPTMITSAQGPIKSIISNYDSFREQNIVPEWEKDLSPLLIDPSKSSRLGKVGQALTFNQMDPRQVEFLIKSTFSYYGDLAIRMSNIGDKNAKDKLDLAVTGFMKESQDSPYTSNEVKWVINKSKEFGLKKDQDYKELELLIELYRNPDFKGDKAKLKKAIDDWAKITKERWESLDLVKLHNDLKE